MENKNQNEVLKFHYDLIRNNENEIIKKLNTNFGYYSFRFDKKTKSYEVIYDTNNNLLENAGVVLSKQISDQGVFFKVRKISRVPSEIKKPSRKIDIAECKPSESPKDFAVQVAGEINNAFSNIFTIDLAEVVKKTVPKLEITIKGNEYEIFGGSGLKGSITIEKAVFKDLITHKRVKKRTVTVSIIEGTAQEVNINNLLNGIEKFCKELIPYKESRYEIARRILNAKNQNRKYGIDKLRNPQNKIEEEKKDEQKEGN